MSVEMDRGALLDSESVVIENGWTAESLYKRIIEISPAFLSKSVRNYLEGRLEPREQDEARASYCSIIKKEDGCIDWQETAGAIGNKIRAYNMWPVAYSSLRGRQLKIYNAEVVEAPSPIQGKQVPGQVASIDKGLGVIVRTGKGYLGITELQMENKRRMGHREFINGHKDLEGDVLGV